jgi:L-aminopeptidase/D-esterase-like protein
VTGTPTVDLAPFGLALGHATDAAGGTGCTVVRGVDGPFRCVAHVVGRATGSRELAVASPDHVADRVDAVLLTGGSAYGLDAAAGVMRWMEERGRGYAVGPGVVPLVPAAVIFDLSPFGRYDARPTPAMAYDACERAASLVTAQGSVGAGTGATVGKLLGPSGAMKGGVGCGAVAADNGRRAAAVAVVNAFGDVRDADGRILAGARAPGGGFADAARQLATDGLQTVRDRVIGALPPLANTTLAVVAVDAALDRHALAQLARAATAALYRRITPCGTTVDGDVVFAVCPADGPAASPLQLEALAGRALEAAIESAVRHAVGRDGIPGLAD